MKYTRIFLKILVSLLVVGITLFSGIWVGKLVDKELTGIETAMSKLRLRVHALETEADIRKAVRLKLYEDNGTWEKIQAITKEIKRERLKVTGLKGIRIKK